MRFDPPDQPIPGVFLAGVRRVRTGDPVLGPLPAHAQALQRASDRLGTDGSIGQALLVAALGGQSQGPEAGGLAEVAGTAVEQFAESLIALGVQDRACRVGACGLAPEAGDALGVQGADGIADGLDDAAEGLGDGCGPPPLGTGGEDLSASEDERPRRAQPVPESLLFREGQRADEEGWFHTLCTLVNMHRISRDPALGHPFSTRFQPTAAPVRWPGAQPRPPALPGGPNAGGGSSPRAAWLGRT